MKKILVTGAGGYIGSVLVPYLLKKKYKVLAVDRFFFGNFLKKNKNLSCLYQDIRTIDKKYFNSSIKVKIIKKRKCNGYNLKNLLIIKFLILSKLNS